MTFAEYQKLIMGTLLIKEEDKHRYIDAARNSTSEMLDRKAGIIKKEEEQLLIKLKKIDEGAKQEARDNVQQQLISLRKLEAQSREKERIQMDQLEAKIMEL